MPTPRWVASSALPIHLLVFALGTAAIYAYGLILLMVDRGAFDRWIREDGVVEWLTFAVLVASFGCALARRTAFGHAPEAKPARTVWLVLALLFAFGALEEVSYGQRVFGIETPHFLVRDSSAGADSFYNRQGEITIHNLSISGVNVNKLVFGKLLTLAAWLYLLVAPVVYRRAARFRRFSDRRAIPIAQNYQLALYLAIVVSSACFLTVHKVVELVEFASCSVVLMMIAHPFNQSAFACAGGRGMHANAGSEGG